MRFKKLVVLYLHFKSAQVINSGLHIFGAHNCLIKFNLNIGILKANNSC